MSTQKRALIFGATSGIGKALIAELARKQYDLILIARDETELMRLSSDLNLRYGIQATHHALDLQKTNNLQNKVHEILMNSREVDELYFLVGYLGDQKIAEKDSMEAEKIMQINYLRPVQILNSCAEYFENRGNGDIVIVGSVAGDRGRPSNYMYGSAKAGLHSFASGLRARLHKKGINVLTVKPGFVDTAMTWGLPGLALVASSQSVAQKIIRAKDKKKSIVYVPFFWRYIMLVVKMIPDKIFVRLST